MRTGDIKSPKRVTTEKPIAATMVVTRPQMMTMTTNEALVGYISDNSGASTLKIAAKAVAFKEANTPESQLYAKQIIYNAQAFAEQLLKRGVKLFTGGTEHRIQALISYQLHVPSHSMRSSVSPQLLVQQHTAMKGLQIDYQ